MTQLINHHLLKSQVPFLYCGSGRGRCGFFPLRGAFDVAGASPGGELGGVAGEFVFDDGVEFLNLLGGLGEEFADEFGVFDAFEGQIVTFLLQVGKTREIGKPPRSACKFLFFSVFHTLVLHLTPPRRSSAQTLAPTRANSGIPCPHLESTIH